MKNQKPCSKCKSKERHKKGLCLECYRAANKRDNSKRPVAEFGAVKNMVVDVGGMTIVEEWKDILNWEGLYQESSFGRIKTTQRYINKKDGNTAIIQSKIRALVSSGNGYFKIVLYRGGIGRTYWVHRLIAETFLPNPENKPQVNHKWGIKTDNRVSELEWATAAEDHLHAEKVLGHRWDKGIRRKGKDHAQSRRIKQINIKTGAVIKIWDCVSDVIRAKIAISASACALGKLNSSGGFKWKYV